MRATGMSGPRRGAGPWCALCGLPGLPTAMARPWLLLFPVIMGNLGCLVTSTPEFEPASQTAPFLIASSADPDNRRMLEVASDVEPLKFSADVLSEDAGERVQVALLVDYGVPNPLTGHVFQDSESFNQPLPPGTLADGPRRISASLVPALRMPTPGCHTITMMVTHEFDQVSGCPATKADSDQLVWFVYKCADEGCPPTVEACPIADPGVSCPDQAGGTP
jgi:hypothetical protein